MESRVAPPDHPGQCVLEACQVNNGDAGVTSGGEKRLYVRDCRPGDWSATARPGLDGLEQWFRVIAKHPAVEVDQQQRRAVAEANRAPRAIAEVLLVLLRQAWDPNSL